MAKKILFRDGGIVFRDGKVQFVEEGDAAKCGCCGDDCGCDDSHASVDLVIPSAIEDSDGNILTAGTYTLPRDDTFGTCASDPPFTEYIDLDVTSSTDGSSWTLQVVWDGGIGETYGAFIASNDTPADQVAYVGCPLFSEYDFDAGLSDGNMDTFPANVEVAEVP